MHSFRFSTLCLSFVLVVLLSLVICSHAEIRDGGAYFNGRHYGNLFDERFFQRAFDTYMHENNVQQGYPFGTVENLRFVGECYCWTKGNIITKKEKTDFILQTTKSCRDKTQIDSQKSELTMMTTHIATMADELLCPAGQANLVTKEPQVPK